MNDSLEVSTKDKKRIRLIIIEDNKEEIIDVDGGIILVAKNDEKETSTAYRVFGSEVLVSLLANLSFLFMKNLLEEIDALKKKASKRYDG